MFQRYYMSRFYGYNRVSSKEQHEDRGNRSIEDFCKAKGYTLTNIYVDKQTGKNYDRSRYKVLKEDVLRPGDTLIISEFDRLGRAKETKLELEYFKDNNIRVIFLDIPTTQLDLNNMQDSMAQMILGCINDMLISFYDLMSRTELERKTKRQREGINEMKARGEWHRYSRPRRMEKNEFAVQYQKVISGTMRPSQLMKELKLSEDTFFRYVREYKNNI